MNKGITPGVEIEISNIHDMKILTASFFTMLTVLGTVCCAVSCSNYDNVEGSWQGAPTRLDVPGTAQATCTATFTFRPGAEKSEGDAVVSAVIDLTDPATAPLQGLEATWEASVGATATMTGRYCMHDDDITLYLNPASLQVNVDPDGVAYRNNIADGTPAPVTDSLTALAAEHYRLLLTAPLRTELGRYHELDDVKVAKGILSADIDDTAGHDSRLTFTRLEPETTL